MQIVAGSATTAAGATINATFTTATSVTIVITNAATPTAFMSGNLFNITFNSNPLATATAKPVSLARLFLNAANGAALPRTIVNGALTLNLPNLANTVLNLSSGSALQGASVTLSGTLNVASGANPTRTVIDLTLPTGVTTSAGQITIGSAAAAVGSSFASPISIQGNLVTIDIQSGLNAQGMRQVLPSGELFAVTFNVALTATPGPSIVQVSRFEPREASGQVLPAAANNGTITVQALPQNTTVTAGSVQGSPGGSAIVPFDIAVSAAAVGLQFSVSLNADLSVAGAGAVTRSALYTNAGFSISVNVVSPQTINVLVINPATPTQLLTGRLFDLQVSVAGAAATGNKAVTINNLTVIDQNSNILPSTAMNGQITVINAPAISQLIVQSQAGTPGNTVTVPVQLQTAANAMPTGIQLLMSWGSDLSVANPNQFAPGNAATIAGAQAFVNILSPTSASIILINPNGPMLISSGEVLRVTFAISAAATMNQAVNIDATVLTDANGAAIASQDVDGQVTFGGAQTPLTTLTVGTISGSAGQTVSVPVNIASVNGAMPVGFQLELTYDADLTNPNATAGTVVTAGRRDGQSIEPRRERDSHHCLERCADERPC
jgi:hypothetical protein